MDSSEINSYRKHFKQYTDFFFGNDEYSNKNFKLKQDHTKRVCGNILDICSSLKLSEQETNIAETIALYHDIGRFFQFKRYRTFSDSKSENHALLGIKELKKEKILDKSKYKTMIFSAIRFHNMKNIPVNVKNEKTLLYSRLIRDADKLDILNVLTNYYIQKKTDNPALDLDLPNNLKYTQEVLEEFFSNRCVNTKFLKSTIDFKILQLSWIYDINFGYTFHIIKKEKFIEKIISELPLNYQKEKIYSHIQKQLNMNQVTF